MVNYGLLVRLEAQHGKEAAVEEFLPSALPIVRGEPGTVAWFAIRFGKGEYGIFDVFPDDAARNTHLTGPAANLRTSAKSRSSRTNCRAATPPNR